MVILFDIDDTLVNHSEAFRAATEVLYRSIDVDMPFERFSLAWTASHRRQFDRYLAGELSYDGQRRARVRDVLERPLSDETADRVFDVYLTSYEAGWSLFPEWSRVWGNCRGIVWGLSQMASHVNSARNLSGWEFRSGSITS